MQESSILLTYSVKSVASLPRLAHSRVLARFRLNFNPARSTVQFLRSSEMYKAMRVKHVLLVTWRMVSFLGATVVDILIFPFLFLMVFVVFVRSYP